MRRREFITVIGGAGAWPIVARAQPATVPTIGVLHPGSPAIGAPAGIEPFRQGLNDAGFVEDRNINLGEGCRAAGDCGGLDTARFRPL